MNDYNEANKRLQRMTDYIRGYKRLKSMLVLVVQYKQWLNERIHSPAFPPKKKLSQVFPVLAVADTGSCVGPLNKVSHLPHRYRQLMQVLILSAREI